MIVEPELIVNATDKSVPEVGTLPVPLHPVHAYRVPVPPATGEVTVSFIDEPVSHQPLEGVGEPTDDVTAK
jgi:hypothetical protein